jgi:hypothetical protein
MGLRDELLDSLQSSVHTWAGTGGARGPQPEALHTSEPSWGPVTCVLGDRQLCVPPNYILSSEYVYLASFELSFENVVKNFIKNFLCRKANAT